MTVKTYVTSKREIACMQYLVSSDVNGKHKFVRQRYVAERTSEQAIERDV